MLNPPGETRDQREELTRRALADVVQARLVARRQRQTDLARWSGVSRSTVLSLLWAEKSVSLFLFLELTRGLGIDDASELLREVLNRRDVLRGSKMDE